MTYYENKKNLLIVFLIFGINTFAQSSVTEIKVKDEIHFITNTVDFPITGTYLFEGTTEPIVELNTNGSGFYQLYEQLKRPIIWGIECNETGEPKFNKGFDNAAYKLWFQYTTKEESDTDNEWKCVEFTIHFNTQKMYIQGERVKNYSETLEH